MSATFTRETSDPIKVTVAVSIEIAGMSNELLSTALTDAMLEIFGKTAE